MQVCPRFKCRKCCSLKLDSQLFIETCRAVEARGSIVARQIGYLSRFMKNIILDLFLLQFVIMYLSFLFSQPQTYKRIILRAVKVDTSCTSVEKSLFKQIVTGDRICPSSSFLCRSCCVCAPQGFVTKHFLDFHLVMN